MYREVNPPPSSLYMAIGHDDQVSQQIPANLNKHYRKIYQDELENNKEIFNHSVFYNTDVTRGQSRGIESGLFSGMFGVASEESTVKNMGKFKGHINIYNIEDEKQYSQ